jgi:NADH-quinone oxidoreductase subunit N
VIESHIVAVPGVDYHGLLPVLIVAGTLLLVVVVDAFLPRDLRWASMGVALAGVVAALVAALTLIGQGTRVMFGGMFVVDSFTLLFQIFFLSVAIVVLALSLRYFRDGRYYQGEYYFLLLTSFLGCLLMPGSRDLVMLFISLELVSAPGFLIAAFRKGDPRSNEAGLKFFLLGVLSAAVMLYGMSIIYGVTGQTRLARIGHVFATANLGSKNSLALAGILLIVVGFAFKVSAVPFQFWAPDTYEGAPVPVAAFLATASKAAGFAGLLQLMFIAFAPKYAFWTPVFATLSILTMSIGNLVALRQTQVVRLLAYSSIAQAGYMLLPFALVGSDAAVNAHAFSAAVSYILIYSIMTLGAFAVVLALSRESRGLLITDFAGFGKRAPVLTVAMAVFMVSLAGIPPTAGFWGKFLIFRVAIEAGGVGVALAVIMLINSVISVGYYFAIPKQMIFVEGEEGERKLRAPVLVGAVAFVALVAILVIGVYPSFIVRFPPLSTLLGSS